MEAVHRYHEAATYCCKNLLPPSSLSCSSLTHSTRSTMASKLSCRYFACLILVSVKPRCSSDIYRTHSIRFCRVSSPSFSISSGLRFGLMHRTSSWSYSSSSSRNSTLSLSLGIIIVPLLFLLPNLGRSRFCEFILSIDESDEIECVGEARGWPAEGGTVFMDGTGSDDKPNDAMDVVVCW